MEVRKQPLRDPCATRDRGKGVGPEQRPPRGNPGAGGGPSRRDPSRALRGKTSPLLRSLLPPPSVHKSSPSTQKLTVSALRFAFPPPPLGDGGPVPGWRESSQLFLNAFLLSFFRTATFPPGLLVALRLWHSYPCH